MEINMEDPIIPKGFNWNDPVAILDLALAIMSVLKDKGVIKQQQYDTSKDMPKDKDTGNLYFDLANLIDLTPN